MNRSGLSAALAVTMTAVLATAPASADTGRIPCPARLPADATCYGGQDANGAFHAFAIPADWNGSLVVHAHGGPDLGAPTAERPAEDLDRWAVVVREGFALAGSSYRRGGYGTRMGAEDTENARKAFGQRFGRPRKTFLHGQSWGGNVAAKTIEIYDSYDAALLTSGVLAGGSRGYDYRVDLRVVYQYYCGNHPRRDEPQYPLWMGLRADSTMTGAGLRARLQECTGHQSPPAERSALQQRNLDDILAVTKVPESALASHLTFATFTFRDIVHHRLGGRNPFGNRGVRYTGSHDDEALNAGVERFSATPSAARDLSYDSDPTGAVSIPVITVHAIGDPTAFVEHETAYRASRVGAGTEGNLVQAFTSEDEHSALSDAEYATALRALVTWESTGRKPTPASIAADCPAADARYGTGCFFDPAYRPAPYSAQVRPRPGGTRWPAMTARQEWLWGRLGQVGIAP
ncbi:hypothetical protein [Saccharothrix texasensis]|uniref:Alpha/beta hydrolase family protein n=1 Tax=Saccharothrix texasensis TaxID=103734 RepID=A0A3N1HJN7_9PSEU|nr:hypothetical protein [Saccharothrix texasensis]ROP42655.1 hypothetical protein EDD40_8163 [Saccharothrix texasensis]